MVSDNNYGLEKCRFRRVLILILLEDGFWFYKENGLKHKGLNPYSTGRWFLIEAVAIKAASEKVSLNPYSTGRWFLMSTTQIGTFYSNRS